MTPSQRDEPSRAEPSGSIVVRAGRPKPISSWPLLDPSRLRQLCEISKLLIRSGEPETTIPAVLAMIDQTLPLRSAIFILCDHIPIWVCWSSADLSMVQLGRAKAIAQRCYDYFMGADVRPYAPQEEAAESGDDGDDGTLVRLPLVVEHSGSMGLCQLQSIGRLTEVDLEFVSAVALQLARALDREALIERQRSISERRRSDAVERQLHAEAKQARAEEEARAVKAERLRMELARATAEALQEQSERRRLLAEEMRDRYRALVDNAEGAFLWEADADTLRVSYVSAGVEALLGFPRLSWLDERSFLLERAHPDERVALDELLRRAKGGAEQRCEHRFVSKDGRVVWFYTGVRRSDASANAVLQGISLRLLSGPHVAWTLTGQANIVPPPPASEGLERGGGAAVDRDELLAAVSHDLKSPLNVILLTVANMAGLPSNDGSARELEQILRAAQRMNRLVRDLLDSARLEAGRLPLEATAVDPGALVEEVVAAQLPLARARSLQLESLVAGDLPVVNVDPSRIQQVLENLIGNAIKFSPPGGDILVGAERVGGSIRFAVRDIGSGIPAAELPHVFERFWQPQRTVRLGTGLGLAIARGIVTAHGGRIWVHSRSGMGSTFYFTLPIAPQG